jgi:hypothetical protein
MIKSGQMSEKKGGDGKGNSFKGKAAFLFS